MLFKHLGWVGTFAPIVLRKFLAVDAFFVFLLVQFIRTIPNELDDSAKIDGCGPYRLFLRVVLPLTVPALATTAIFTFSWTWNDFFSQLLYLGGKVQSYSVPVALGCFVDSYESVVVGTADGDVVPVAVADPRFLHRLPTAPRRRDLTTGLKG